MSGKKTITSQDKRIMDTLQCLNALGSAWRNDWSDFDGRTLRDQLDDIALVLNGESTYKDFLEDNWIDVRTLNWDR